MIQNFEEIRDQLEKLAPVINAYKSEAVQLRIVELVLSRSAGTPPLKENRNDDQQLLVESVSDEATQSNRKPRKPTAKKTGRPGPGAIVDGLIAEGFFKSPRGVSDIVKHCRDSKVLTYSLSEISVGVSRAVKSGKLRREKTNDDQFTYSLA